jgi:hypothetical protein
MAVYKLFPEKDAFIWSEQQTQNMGRDEILEISTYNDPDIVNGNLNLIPSVTRALVKFPQQSINTVLDQIINRTGTGNWNVFFNLYLANASSLPQTYALKCNAISQSWEMGTGKLADRPRTHNGVSWEYRSSSSSAVTWQTSSFQTNVTSSDNGISGQRGGGNWFIFPSSSLTFNYTSNKDINFAVKPIVERWHSHSLHPNVYPESFGNEGFIVRYTGSLEFNTASIQQLSYFSMDTHTIYPPALTFMWADYVNNPGTSSIVNNNQFITTIGNIQPELPSNNVYRFNVYSRDQYPPRSFQTQSVYLNTKILPTASYWALKDVITGEMVVDFDPIYTRLSSNPSYNYFDVYADGLEPERYYQILIQTTIGDQTITVDNPDYYFKIVR